MTTQEQIAELKREIIFWEKEALAAGKDGDAYIAEEALRKLRSDLARLRNEGRRQVPDLVRQFWGELAANKVSIIIQTKWHEPSFYSNDIAVALLEERAAAESALAKANTERDALKLQAEAQAQEMRCHRSSLHEAYQYITGATGEPGNWNDAKPIKGAVDKLRARITELEAQEHTMFTDAQIKHMVDRFLAWRLPQDFNPDAGITYTRPNYASSIDATPMGTNLLNAEQAEALVRHLIDGLPELEAQGERPGLEQAAEEAASAVYDACLREKAIISKQLFKAYILEALCALSARRAAR